VFNRVIIAAALTVFAGTALADRVPGDRSLSDTDWGYAIVATPTRAGDEAQRFEVRPGDCASNGGWDDCARDRERSEFRPDLEWLPGEPMWISFSVFLPLNFAVSDHVKTTIAQIHQRGGPVRVAEGLTSRPPVMQMELRGDEMRLTVHVPGQDNIHRPLATLTELRGGWVDVVLAFNSGPTPRMQVWMNGSLRADVLGWHTTPPEFYYFKYGIYRSFVSRHGGPMPQQVLFFDELRMGPDADSVRLDPWAPVD